MGANRSSLGFGGELDDFDPGAWSAPPPPRPKSAPEPAARRLAEAAGFKSREPAPTAPARPDRRRRTGRNVQFNVKARPQTIAAFCDIADAQGWGLGETLEKAVALLEERYGGARRDGDGAA